VIAVGQLRYAGRRAGGDDVARAQRQGAGEKPDVLAQGADHVAGMGLHHRLAVLFHADVQVLRVVDFVAGDDPGPEAREGVEALANVAGVVAALSPGVAQAEIPAYEVAEHVLERPLLGDFARRPADDGAQLALEVHVHGDFGQDHRAAGTRDGRSRFQKELGHQLVLAHAGAVVRSHPFDHFGLVSAVIRRRGPDGARVGDIQHFLSDFGKLLSINFADFLKINFFRILLFNLPNNTDCIVRTPGIPNQDLVYIINHAHYRKPNISFFVTDQCMCPYFHI